VIVISDTSPITNLAAIGQLDILRLLYGDIIIPTAVYNEMAGLGKVVPGTAEVQTFPWIKTQSVTNSVRVADILENRENIDLGEAESIILALELKANILLIDERRGRAVAMSYGLNVTGLLGILIQAKQNGLILSVKPLIDKLIVQANFRISSQLYALVLETAGE
jgi:uncharacterized protein